MTTTTTDDNRGISRDTLQRARRIGLVRWLGALHETGGSVEEAKVFIRDRHPRMIGLDAIESLKAPVGASALLSPPTFAQAFVELADPGTLLVRLGVRPVPFYAPISESTTPAAFGWVPPGQPAPVARLTFSPGEALDPTKLQGIIALSAEWLKLQTPAAADFVIAELARHYRAFLDRAFVDVAFDGSDGGPAAITDGVSPIASAGSSAADAVEDFRRALSRYIGGGGSARTAVYLVSSTQAAGLAHTGHEFFRGLTADGGTVGGIRTLASDAVGDQLVLMDAAGLRLADEGESDFSTSTHASLEMDDTPTQDGSAGTGVVGSSLVSMFQNNLVGVKLARTVNWRMDGAVSVIDGTSYASSGSPA